MGAISMLEDFAQAGVDGIAHQTRNKTRRTKILALGNFSLDFSIRHLVEKRGKDKGEGGKGESISSSVKNFIAVATAVRTTPDNCAILLMSLPPCPQSPRSSPRSQLSAFNRTRYEASQIHRVRALTSHPKAKRDRPICSITSRN